jgi:hypothetical protein
LENFGVPESDHTKSARFEKRRPSGIGGALGVLAPVHFDDQAPFQTDEIEDEAIERRLASEFVPVELAHAQLRPKSPLGVRHSRAKRAGERHAHRTYAGFAAVS